MPRKSVTDDAVFQEMVRQLAPLKNRIANARHEAAEMVENAKKEVEQQTLEIVAWGLAHGMSQYAVGKATGKTRASDQRELVERARQFGGH